MNNIDPSINRSSFFPKSREAQQKRQLESTALRRNSSEKMQALKDLTSNDAKVSISNRVKDFSRIKRAVDVAPQIDNSDKVASLKQRIASGTYNIDYDALADKMLQGEF